MDRDLINNSSNFDAVISIIENAKNRAFRAVNKELINKIKKHAHTGKE